METTYDMNIKFRNQVLTALVVVLFLVTVGLLVGREKGLFSLAVEPAGAVESLSDSATVDAEGFRAQAFEDVPVAAESLAIDLVEAATQMLDKEPQLSEPSGYEELAHFIDQLEAPPACREVSVEQRIALDETETITDSLCLLYPPTLVEMDFGWARIEYQLFWASGSLLFAQLHQMGFEVCEQLLADFRAFAADKTQAVHDQLSLVYQSPPELSSGLYLYDTCRADQEA